MTNFTVNYLTILDRMADNIRLKDDRLIDEDMF